MKRAVAHSCTRLHENVRPDTPDATTYSTTQQRTMELTERIWLCVSTVQTLGQVTNTAYIFRGCLRGRPSILLRFGPKQLPINLSSLEPQIKPFDHAFA